MTVLEPGVRAPAFARRFLSLGTENAFRIAPLIAAIERTGRRVIRCNVGEPDFALPQHIADEVKRQIDAGQTHYVDPQGIEPLRTAIARTVGERRGIDVDPGRVVVFPGAKPPIGFAQMVYCNPGDEVICPSPGFPIYESFTRFLDLKPVALPLREENDFMPLPADLHKLIGPRTKLLFLNFPSNPTGGVANRQQLEEIAAVVRREASPDLRIYSDEVYEDILFDGATHASIASLPEMAERTIIVSGVSKSYAWTGGRVGWAVFPSSEEAVAFRNLNINFFSCVPAYNQHGARVALESPESATSIATMVSSFQQRRDVAVQALNAIDGITCRMPRGAFYLFPNISGVCRRLGIFDAHSDLPESIRGRIAPSTLFQMFLLHEYQVATLDRRSFGVLGSAGEHYLRFSIATAMEDLMEAVTRVGQASKDMAGFRRFMKEERYL